MNFYALYFDAIDHHYKGLITVLQFLRTMIILSL